jgi:predicted site-specific integrase-resolvase
MKEPLTKKLIKQTMKKENMKVIIYARLASREQNEDTHNALEKQVKACHEYCDKNNLDALMEIRELGSGSACMNPGLAEYLQHVTDTQYKHQWDCSCRYNTDFPQHGNT